MQSAMNKTLAKIQAVVFSLFSFLQVSVTWHFTLMDYSPLGLVFVELEKY